jgi:hypothetical protein
MKSIMARFLLKKNCIAIGTLCINYQSSNRKSLTGKKNRNSTAGVAINIYLPIAIPSILSHICDPGEFNW